MQLLGIPVNPGRVMAKSYVLVSARSFDLEQMTAAGPEESKRRIDDAMQCVMAQFGRTKEIHRGNGNLAALIEVQETMLTDSYFLEEIYTYTAEGYAPEAAVLRAARTQEEMLRSLGDSVMAARADDMHDASSRLAYALAGMDYPDLSCLPSEVIVAVEDLLPSVLLNADFGKLKGIVTETGTRTSHVSILAASMDIPMVAGCAGAAQIPPGQLLYLDSGKGIVEWELSDDDITRRREQVQAYKNEKKELLRFVSRPAVTIDGESICLGANIIEPVVLGKVLEYGMDGVGLFRTEFLYMNRNTPPSEEEQFAVYKMAAEKLMGRPLVIRTMDIGGDKSAECLDLLREENPFLGFRAVRICLARPDIFGAQLRAILRAGSYGDVRVMFPMIATRPEIDAVLGMLEREKLSLREKGVPFKEDLKVGIMVEIPSAAIMLDTMVDCLDFVSIGSNDLIQYTLAADRLNKQVEYLYNCMDPAVLRLIKRTVDIAGKAGIECSLCGEMGGDRLGLAALVALGIRKFSISTSLGLLCKKRFSLLCAKELAGTGQKMLEAASAHEAARILEAALPAEYH